MHYEGSSMRSISRIADVSINTKVHRREPWYKKLDKHIHALALYFAFYNFCHIHTSLKVTPAMAAGITDRLWSLEDIVGQD